jgi:hypothetical protein
LNGERLRSRAKKILTRSQGNKVKFGKPQNQNNMKRILGLLSITALLFACNNENTDSPSSSSADTLSKTETASLPYTVEKTPDWEKGSEANVAIAMNTLRAFETNDLASIGQYLADSVEFYVDTIQFKGTKEELIKLFSEVRGSMETYSVSMKDYESVKSKNRNEEWVGLWYTEMIKPKGGKLDSLMCMDDIKIVGGKVALIDSKNRGL